MLKKGVEEAAREDYRQESKIIQMQKKTEMT